MSATAFEKSIKKGLEEKPILLMTHIVLGYPSFDDNMKALQAMAKGGVRHIELQIPFSEPTADGPAIARACQKSIEGGTTVEQCFQFAAKASQALPEVSFLIMTYVNILYRMGAAKLVERTSNAGMKGFIIPDLPPEEADEFMTLCKQHDLASIYIFTPATSPERLSELGRASTGMVYCVGRTGVTGKKTEFTSEMTQLLSTYRQSTNLPIGVGFGISSKQDIEFLKGKSDLAVIGSMLLETYDREGEVGVAKTVAAMQLS